LFFLYIATYIDGYRHRKIYQYYISFLQHSLVSEIRDIIYPEDRLRFDELMFRHGVTVNVLSNNVATLYGRSGVC